MIPPQTAHLRAVPSDSDVSCGDLITNHIITASEAGSLSYYGVLFRGMLPGHPPASIINANLCTISGRSGVNTLGCSVWTCLMQMGLQRPLGSEGRCFILKRYRTISCRPTPAHFNIPNTDSRYLGHLAPVIWTETFNKTRKRCSRQTPTNV